MVKYCKYLHNYIYIMCVCVCVLYIEISISYILQSLLELCYKPSLCYLNNIPAVICS